MLHSVRPTIRLQAWWLLKQELSSEADPWRAKEILDQTVTPGQQEIANAEATIPLVEADPRLGWEPSRE